MDGSPPGQGLAAFESVAARIAAALPLPRIETLPLDRALGRVPAAPVTAGADVPDAPRARRPGLAVRAEETLGAGPYAPAPLSRAVPVAAGDALPEDTDAVLPEQAAERLGGQVIALATLAPGENTMPAAADVAAGTVVMAAGARLHPRAIGAALAAGCREVSVRAAPRVAIELPGPAGAMLRAALRAGAAPPSAPAAADGPPDVIVRPADGLPRLAVRPIEDASLEAHDGTWILRLPDGAAAWLGWAVIGAPLLARLAGEAPPAPTTARLEARIVSAVGMTDLVPVALESGAARPLAAPEAPGFSAIARADGLVIIPPGSEGLPAGAAVSVQLFGP